MGQSGLLKVHRSGFMICESGSTSVTGGAVKLESISRELSSPRVQSADRTQSTSTSTVEIARALSFHLGSPFLNPLFSYIIAYRRIHGGRSYGRPEEAAGRTRRTC